MQRFTLSRQPRLVVQDGALQTVPELVASYGSAVVVTGGPSIRDRREWHEFQSGMDAGRAPWIDFVVRGEPSPGGVDDLRHQVRSRLAEASVVVAIGGGSVIDAAKALAAALTMEGGIAGYLEGVGDRTPPGTTVPLIAVPTTAGTGSEATKNAVLSDVGAGGFKKSLRHEAFVPVAAVIDATLHRDCPVSVTRASGLDAVTQLIEAYVSTGANPLVDALVELGLTYAGRSLPRLLSGEDEVDARREMALAAYISGVALGNSGLGVVHGIASPAGALRQIPHGVVCGLLVAEATEMSVARGGGVEKYASAARILTGGTGADATDRMIELLREWAGSLPRLSAFGFDRDAVRSVASVAGNKNQPYAFSMEEIAEMMERVL